MNNLMNNLMNIFLKTIKFLSLVALVLLVAAFAFLCISDGFFLFMVPFLLSLAFFYLLYTKLQSKSWFLDIATDLFFNILLAIIILILLGALFLILGYNDLNLLDTIIDTIYCDGVDASDSLSNQPTKMDSPGNSSNLSSNNLDMHSKSNSSKIELDKDKYYHIRKDSVDKGVDILSKGLEVGIEKVKANVGAASAAGTAAATVLKSNLPVLPKLALAGASAVVVGASTKIGIAVGGAILTRNSANTSTGSFPITYPDRLPSPTEFFVPSILEAPEVLSPLEELIRYQFILNFLILFSAFILLTLMFNKLFLSNNIFVSFITRFFNKDLVFKFDSYRIKIDKFNNSFFFLLFGIITLTLLFNIFLSIVISCELTFELDYYLAAHNGIKYSSCT